MLFKKAKTKNKKIRIANKFLNNVYIGLLYLPSSIFLLFSCFLEVTKYTYLSNYHLILQRGEELGRTWETRIWWKSLTLFLGGSHYSPLPSNEKVNRKMFKGCQEDRKGGSKWIIHKIEEMSPKYLERHKISFE